MPISTCGGTAATVIASTYRRALSALPEGGSPPPEVWQPRHLALVRLLWAHSVVVPAFAALQGYSVLHSFLDAAPIAVLVTPKVDGPELVRQLLGTKPRLRVLYISGYTREAINGRAGLTTGTAFLQKPFTMETLATTVRAVLDEPALVAV